jgi:Zinc knuckle
MARGKGGGRGGGQQKYCKNCQKNGHTTQECYNNKNKNNSNNNSNGGNGKGNKNGQQNNGGGKYCSNCDMRNHNTEDCSKKGNNNNSAQNQNQGHIQAYGAYQTPQVPDFNGQPIVFNDPCQICSQRGHIARDCPNHASFIPPQAGAYFPQTYREPSAIPAPYQPPQQQWQQPIQNQSYRSNPSVAMELIGEEVSKRPILLPPVQFVQDSARHVWQFGYIPPEIACERPRIQDKDGDFMMADSWECGECLIPARQDDGMQRWTSAPYQQPQQQVAWGSCY